MTGELQSYARDYAFSGLAEYLTGEPFEHAEELDGLRFLKLGGKTIYYLPVQISNEASASKSGKAEEVIITKVELVTSVVE